jgi:rRNA processing protein Krr1/Pno1
MSTITGDNEMIPLALGVSVVAIILVAFFSNRDEGDKKKAVAAPAPTTATATSKKSKKKKPLSSSSSSKAKAAPAAEKDVVVREPTPPPVAFEPEPEPEPVVEVAEKKKKRKPKNKSTTTADPDPTPTPPPPPSSTKNGSSDDKDDSDDDDDDVELWRIQLAAKKGKSGIVAIDAAKRAAANKERDRVRAIRRQEEKAKAEARAIAEEEERAAAEAALAAAEEEKKKVEEGSAKAKKNGNGASAQAGANGKAVAFANHALAATASNGNADLDVAEKKKRKRNKKKGGASGVLESRPPLVKPAASPSVELWEVVPMVEEWQEVNTKKAKPKNAPSPDVIPADVAGVGEDAAPLLTDEPAEEQAGETSVTISAGDDPLIIIGKGGATIQKLQETTGAKFHLNRSTNILTITGMEDAVQLGVTAAQAVLAAEAERKAAEVEESVTWGSDAIKAVIGRGGANIRAAQEATGTSINADVDAGTLIIVGPADRVSIALTMCHNAAFGEVQDVLELGSRNAVNLIYGPNFQTIRTLQESTGCKLDIARGGTTLKLAGSADAVASARAQILALLEMNRGFEMTIEISKVGAVYGKGGETLRTIQDKTGTQIDVARGPTHATVSVMGTLEASSRARNMLQRAIDGEVELRPGEVAEEIELGSATAAVIGRGGSNVVELEKKYGVKVNVRSEFQKARVVGKPEKVTAAMTEISAIVKPILAAKNAQKKADDELKTGESAWVAENLADDVEGW